MGDKGKCLYKSIPINNEKRSNKVENTIHNYQWMTDISIKYQLLPKNITKREKTRHVPPITINTNIMYSLDKGIKSASYPPSGFSTQRVRNIRDKETHWTLPKDRITKIQKMFMGNSTYQIFQLFKQIEWNERDGKGMGLNTDFKKTYKHVKFFKM